jgi:hypothetical protein
MLHASLHKHGMRRDNNMYQHASLCRPDLGQMQAKPSFRTHCNEWHRLLEPCEALEAVLRELPMVSAFSQGLAGLVQPSVAAALGASKSLPAQSVG